MLNRPATAGAVDIDIARIANAKELDPKAITYQVILHTIDDDMAIDELVSIETSRDYSSNICDYTLVTFTLPLGDYVRKVNVNMDNLEMTIITKFYDKSYTDRHKLVIVKAPSNIAGSIYSSYTTDELNTMDKVIVEGQCLNRLVEALRLKPVNGIYSQTTVNDVMATVIHTSIRDIDVEDTKVVTNINIVKPNNQQIFRHISIPIGIHVLDLPTYLQNSNYGVYNADIGTYVQKYGYFKKGIIPKETVFIYPLYNHELADIPGKKLTIFSTPTTRLSMIDSTYIENGDIVEIIGHGDMSSNEIGQSQLISDGNSIITTPTDNIMVTTTVVTNDTVTTDNKTNVTGENLKKPNDSNMGTNYTKPMSNLYKVRSEVSKNMLSSAQVTWRHSNPELLIPGMPVRYVYDDVESGVITVFGVLHSSFTKYSHPHKMLVTILNILLEPRQQASKNNPSVVDVSR